MSLMPNMKLQPLKPRDRSWLYTTCAVVAVHSLIISWTVFFNGEKQLDRPPKMDSRLIVQTIALNSNPIPRNPIPSNRVSPSPIPNTPITPTPLERKTMWPEKPVETPRAPDPAKPVPAPITPAATETPTTPTTTTPTTTTIPPLKPTAKPYVKPPLKPAATPVTPVKMKNAHQAPATKAPEKYVPHIPEDRKDSIKSALDKANEDFKAKQHEISIKRKLEMDAVKTKQTEDTIKKKQEQDALKKKQEEASKKKAAEHLAETQRQQKFTEAQERIAKIGGSRDKIAAKTANHTLSAAPHAITNLEVDTLSNLKENASLSRYEMSYREELAGRLKLLLRLPEYGDVKVNLTLDRTGKVAKVAIVNAESVVNRKYIEKTLPGLSFPAFGTNYASASEYTFSITLSNEI